MPLGIVKDDEFAAELEKLNNPTPVKPEIVEMNRPGRHSDDLNVPMSIRKIIGESAIEDGNKEANQLARQFGISPASVSAYKNGATSTDSYNRPNPELKNTVDLTKKKIASRAKGRILQAIKQITDDKLENAKAVDLSAIAKNLSGVVEKMEPEGPKITGNGPTFVFYTPPQKKEESYDVIQLKE